MTLLPAARGSSTNDGGGGLLPNNSVNRIDRVCAEGHDPDQLSAILSSSVSKLTAKPATKEGIHFKCEFATTDAMTVGACSYKGKLLVQRESGSDRTLIFVPRHGFATFDVGGNEVLTSPRQGVIFDCNRNSAIMLSGPREHLVVVVNRTALCARLSNILGAPVSGPLDFLPEIDLTTGPGAAIAQTVAALHAGLIRTAVLRHAPLAQASLTDALLELMIEILPHRLSDDLYKSSAAMPRHVKCAIEFMKANLKEALSSEDIALAANVSLRTLYDGFKRFKMTTPMAYLQFLRLGEVNRELSERQPDQGVSDIAMKWGFTHLGRFAAEYRRRFGEFPSETLRSSRSEQTT